MAGAMPAARATRQAKIRLPWFVKVSPKFYDDAFDTGYGWEGWARDEHDALAQALEECRLDNDRDPEDREADLNPQGARVHVAEIDFRRLAGPLVHWARSEGGCETPLWKAMEAAVMAAGLPVLPLGLSETG
ncbi:MAG: hypothetical protein M3T55_02665 [Pseudomonadota bacterium]|nr:hypothetical protein [Pseudomonadota bacterium]